MDASRLDDEHRLLEAIAAVAPTKRVPDVDGLSAERRTDALYALASKNLVAPTHFLGVDTIPPGDRLRLTPAGDQALRVALEQQDAQVVPTNGLSVEERRQRR